MRRTEQAPNRPCVGPVAILEWAPWSGQFQAADLFPAGRPDPGRGRDRSHGGNRRPVRGLAESTRWRPIRATGDGAAPVYRKPLLDRGRNRKGIGCRIHDGPTGHRAIGSGRHRLTDWDGEAQPRLLCAGNARGAGSTPCGRTACFKKRCNLWGERLSIDAAFQEIARRRQEGRWRPADARRGDVPHNARAPAHLSRYRLATPPTGTQTARSSRCARSGEFGVRGDACKHRRHRLCAVECLNLALLIDTEQGWSPFRLVIGQAMCTRHPYHPLAI